jgi:hypothetical protein
MQLDSICKGASVKSLIQKLYLEKHRMSISHVDFDHIFFSIYLSVRPDLEVFYG